MMESYGSWKFSNVYVDEKATPGGSARPARDRHKVLPIDSSPKKEIGTVAINARESVGRSTPSRSCSTGKFSGTDRGRSGRVAKIRQRPPGADPLPQGVRPGTTTLINYIDAGKNWNFENSNYMFGTFQLDSEMYESKTTAGLAQKMAARRTDALRIASGSDLDDRDLRPGEEANPRRRPFQADTRLDVHPECPHAVQPPRSLAVLRERDDRAVQRQGHLSPCVWPVAVEIDLARVASGRTFRIGVVIKEQRGAVCGDLSRARSASRSCPTGTAADPDGRPPYIDALGMAVQLPHSPSSKRVDVAPVTRYPSCRARRRSARPQPGASCSAGTTGRASGSSASRPCTPPDPGAAPPRAPASVPRRGPRIAVADRREAPRGSGLFPLRSRRGSDPGVRDFRPVRLHEIAVGDAGGADARTRITTPGARDREPRPARGITRAGRPGGRPDPGPPQVPDAVVR